METKWHYEKIDPEDGKIKIAPPNDPTGKYTGHHVFGLQAWFDEHPAERIALGWIKHLHKETKDIEYDKRTQYLVKTVKTIDAYTVEDEFHVMDKSEEMMRLAELLVDEEVWVAGEVLTIGW